MPHGPTLDLPTEVAGSCWRRSATTKLADLPWVDLSLQAGAASTTSTAILHLRRGRRRNEICHRPSAGKKTTRELCGGIPALSQHNSTCPNKGAALSIPWHRPGAALRYRAQPPFIKERREPADGPSCLCFPRRPSYVLKNGPQIYLRSSKPVKHLARWVSSIRRRARRRWWRPKEDLAGLHRPRQAAQADAEDLRCVGEAALEPSCR